eukprot:CAMPEP_0115725122 /NCGR_PEP_ID=MMETSP0272-20121206/81140_1 /TAXON_ID=71861 /ORGANISM="Scrippsiella trochoidea, Strain CCMP3099" /LENGTH=146 /DNA_ID=CAMNT_0003168385 /DNA_START=105 /DNA_END=543 /DNA_ORIENTATION=+
MELVPSLDVLLPTTTARIAQLAHHVLIKPILRADDATRGWPEVHGAVAQTELPAAVDVHECMVARATLLATQPSEPLLRLGILTSTYTPHGACNLIGPSRALYCSTVVCAGCSRLVKLQAPTYCGFLSGAEMSSGGGGWHTRLGGP